MKTFYLSILFVFLMLPGCSSDGGSSEGGDSSSVVPTLSAFSAAVDENTTVGTVIGAITISDTGDSAITAITLSGTNSIDFSVETNGTITVANPLDYETLPSYNLTAVATNAAGSSPSVDVNITINDIADIAPTLQPFTATVANGTNSGTVIGDINISDNGESTTIYDINLTGTGADDFNVSTNGTVTVVNPPDYGTQAIYNLTAIATSDAGASAEVPVTIMVDVKLTASVPEAQDYFGSSVAISGNYVVVGAEGNASKAGSAYIFLNDGTGNYSQVAELNASNALPGDKFGISVAIDGDYVVVGAQLADTNASDAGTAYVFKNDGLDSYTEVAILTASDPAADDHFGYSVAMDGDYVIVGADNKTGADAGDLSTGAAYVFKRDTGLDSYTLVNKLMASDPEPGDYFGWSVDINGEHAVVGAFSESMGGLGVIDAGAAYVFRRVGTGTYDFTDKLMADPADAEPYDHFGWSVGIGINGLYVVVGANADNVDANNTGAAYIFQNDGLDSYNLNNKLIASDAVEDDSFGHAVSISGDYVVVGAESKDPASDIGGNRGAAYLYQNDGFGNFTEVAKFNAHDTSAGHYFGSSVAISGFDMAIGAESYFEFAKSEMGSAYLFNFAP